NRAAPVSGISSSSPGGPPPGGTPPFAPTAPRSTSSLSADGERFGPRRCFPSFLRLAEAKTNKK
ncbi:unnamed protein product, partial [Ectocarpus sp. 6 AP-2014]